MRLLDIEGLWDVECILAIIGTGGPVAGLGTFKELRARGLLAGVNPSPNPSANPSLNPSPNPSLTDVKSAAAVSDRGHAPAGAVSESVKVVKTQKAAPGACAQNHPCHNLTNQARDA
eukprot:1045897-Prorocentrum_minimum.AAC.3